MKNLIAIMDKDNNTLTLKKEKEYIIFHNTKTGKKIQKKFKTKMEAINHLEKLGYKVTKTFNLFDLTNKL